MCACARACASWRNRENEREVCCKELAHRCGDSEVQENWRARTADGVSSSTRVKAEEAGRRGVCGVLG